MAWVLRQLTGRTGPSDTVAPGQMAAGTDDGPAVEDVFHDAALRLLDQQIRINETLDGRTLQVFTIGSTVLPLTFALLSLTDEEVPSIAAWFLSAALAVYASLIVCAAGALRRRLLEYRPEIDTLARLTDQYRSLPDSGVVLRQWVAREYQQSINENRPLLASKGRWVGWINAALLVECLLLAVAAGVTLLL